MLYPPEYPPAIVTRDTGIFGQEVLQPATGNRQGGLFHEPVTLNRPSPERIGSVNASDPRHTASMFSPSPCAHCGVTRRDVRTRNGDPFCLPCFVMHARRQRRVTRLSLAEIIDGR